MLLNSISVWIQKECTEKKIWEDEEEKEEEGEEDERKKKSPSK